MYWPLGAPRIYVANKPPPEASEENEEEESDEKAEQHAEPTAVLGLQVSRSGRLFSTITEKSLSIWQTSPVLLLASFTRSIKSLNLHGRNISVHLKPDASIALIQTSLGCLITYSIITDPVNRVYQQYRQDGGKSRRQSGAQRFPLEEELAGQRQVHLRYRMVMKIDSRISKAIVLDDEIMVATEKPALIQCIRWPREGTDPHTTSESLSRMTWIGKKAVVQDMIYSRAMSLYVWITIDGNAYAVQRESSARAEDGTKKLFRGYKFHTASSEDTAATTAAINARFSLLAIGCASAEVLVYAARDYAGNVPLSHRLSPPPSETSTGKITSMSYSPDGYCLFVGYENGWMMWSVYGQPGGNSFGGNRTISIANEEAWLTGVTAGHWLNGGSEIMLTCQNDDRIWVLAMARSAVSGCFCAANTSRMMLQTSDGLMVYRGYDTPDLLSSSADPSFWQSIQIPQAYLLNQGPIRCAVISLDGRYVAVAGRRGLAHYSVHSNRWKTFNDLDAEHTFVVRGGMCWHQHILITAVETDDENEASSALRLYSREHSLTSSSAIFIERLPAPAVVISQVGEDSLLVYTHENILYHFIITLTTPTVQLVQVGQIGLHGIVRAPARVRGVSWIIPEHQLRDGDPSQDVVHASVMFLVDAKLVFLSPSRDETGELRYDMRLIASDVEYFAFMRDQAHMPSSPSNSTLPSPVANSPSGEASQNGFQIDNGLQDALFYFDGRSVKCWTDVQDILTAVSTENGGQPPLPISIPTDFYPTSIVLNKAIIIGLEPDLAQRQDVNFAFFRFTIRTQLFLPSILHHHLANNNTPAALSLSHRYTQLPYFSHALEILLHIVLDEEAEATPREDPLLPSILSFLSSFPEYLDILVQCTRKTEVSSWRTLYRYLPSPQQLFEESMQKGMLKTAGGYLLVLHTFEELDSGSKHIIRLLARAKEANDWDLCKELARFLMSLDESGDTLRHAAQDIGISLPSAGRANGNGIESHTKTPQAKDVAGVSGAQGRRFSNKGKPVMVAKSNGPPNKLQEPTDYFSTR